MSSSIQKNTYTFAYYLVSSPTVKKQLDRRSQQTKIRHTSPKAIKDCVSYLPWHEQQVKIGNLLNTIEKTIQLNAQINDNSTQAEFRSIQLNSPGSMQNQAGKYDACFFS